VKTETQPPRCCRVARIAVSNTSYSFDILFSYLIPEHLILKAKTGCRVLVGFGNSKTKRQGIIFSISDEEQTTSLKSIYDVIDEEPVLSESMLRLAMFISERTFCTIYDSAKAMLPFGLGMKLTSSYALSEKGMTDSEDESLTYDEKQILSYIGRKKGYVKRDNILSALGLSEDEKIIDNLVSGGYLSVCEETVRNVNDAVEKTVSLSDFFLSGKHNLKFTQKQKTIIDLLTDVGSASVKEICYFTGLSAAVSENLIKKNILTVSQREVYRTPKFDGGYMEDKSEIVLSDEQQRAYDILKNDLDSHSYRSQLLFGVTGSGKTKIYMKLIDSVAGGGQSVIVMVPEISLTPQLLSQFYSRYGSDVAVMHSGLSVGERLDEFKRIKRGDAHIIVGTRSAVFAPVKNLCMIVIDEEQESSYKSEMSPKYHARDAAKFRCADEKALLVLASATPSVESFAFAKAGRYGLIELKNRYSSSGLPDVMIADMSDKREMNGLLSISSTLKYELEKNLESGQQSILLINRRGYNTFVACKSCKTVLTCPNCSISLTYHSANNRLMCHYCGYSEPLRTVCPKCSSETVRYSGFGTQKVEQELETLFPDARVLRVDADTMSYKNSHEVKFREFADGKYDIMIGTQMVAKGLNFPNVTLVGVVSVDQQLYNDDFRSMEKTFDLLTQVIGRSGRGDKSGRAVIQTVIPDNPIIRFAARQDYISFYNNESAIRRGLIYPPFCDICAISFSSDSENYSMRAAHAFLEMIKSKVGSDYESLKLIILGPVAPKVAKINNKFRERIIIKCKNSVLFRKMITECLREFSKIRDFSHVTVSADINPDSTF